MEKSSAKNDGLLQELMDLRSRNAELQRLLDGMPRHTPRKEQDLSERKRADQALRESEERLRMALRASGTGAWSWDMATNQVVWSDENYAVLGYAPGSVSSSFDRWLDRIHPEDKASAQESVEKAVAAKGDLNLEFRVVWSDGSVHWINDVGKMVLDDAGRPLGMYGIQLDITDRKRLDEELTKHHKLDSIGVLAGGLAHDFNNVLTAILGNINLAKMHLDPRHKAYERLVEAEKASIHAGELTQQFMTFTRGGDPVKTKLALSELIHDATGFALRGSPVKCEYSLARDLWLIHADRGQISRVIHNLVINAVQAMPEGGVLWIRAANFTVSDASGLMEPGPYVKITIADQGTGIPSKLLTRIFDPYFTTKQQGSGLGLAITHSIVTKHNGYITVDSTVGKGTSFDILLPAVPGRIAIPLPSEDASLMPGKGRILVMDDEEMVERTAGAMLSTLGYDVAFARSGEEAVALCRKEQEAGRPFDAVVLDLTVPGAMGGKEAVGKIKEACPGIRALVSSGYSRDPVMAHFTDHGFDEVIAKPYDIMALGKVLRHILQRDAPQRSGQ